MAHLFRSGCNAKLKFLQIQCSSSWQDLATADSPGQQDSRRAAAAAAAAVPRCDIQWRIARQRQILLVHCHFFLRLVHGAMIPRLWQLLQYCWRWNRAVQRDPGLPEVATQVCTGSPCMANLNILPTFCLLIFNPPTAALCPSPSQLCMLQRCTAV